MNDFLQGDDSTGSYDDFMQSIMPAFSGVGGSTGTTGVAVMGFADAGLDFAAGDPAGGVIKAVQTAFSLVGRGRKEADEITAVQTPVSALLEQVNREMGAANITVERLNQLRAFVVAAGGQLQQVIAKPWPDGRAAKQATATMFGDPGYLRVTIENIDKMLGARGVGPLAATMQPAAAAGGSGTIIAGLAALAYAIFG